MCLRVRHNFIAWHQRQHLNLTIDSDCKICTTSGDNKQQQFVLGNRAPTTINVVYPTIIGNIAPLSHRFVNIVKKKKCLTRLNVANAAISLLSFRDSNDGTTDIGDLLALTMCAYDFYDVVERFNSKFSNDTITRENRISVLRRALHHEIPFDSYMLNYIHRMLLAENLLPDLYIILLVRKVFDCGELLHNLFDGYLCDTSLELVLSEHMLSLICLTLHNCNVLIRSVDGNDYQYTVLCNSCKSNCSEKFYGTASSETILPISAASDVTLSDDQLECILRLLMSEHLTVRLNTVKCLPAICHSHSHVLCATNNLYWTNIFNDIEMAKNFQFLKIIPQIVNGINVNSVEFESDLLPHDSKMCFFLVVVLRSPN